jgi:hypothetical protein
MAQALANDLKAIEDKNTAKTLETEQKEYDDRLKLLQIQGQSLIAGTQAYFDNRQDILNQSMERELLGVKKGSEEELAIKKKYAKLIMDLNTERSNSDLKVVEAYLGSIASIGNALASAYDEEAKTSKAAFEERKKLQRASAIIGAAAAVVGILSAPPIGNVVVDAILKGLRIAAVGIQTQQQIRKIDETQFEAPSSGEKEGAPINVVATRAQGGIVTGSGTSTSDSIPTRLSNGEFVVNARATQSFLPLLNSINDAGLQPRFAMGGLYSDNNANSLNVGNNISDAITSSFSNMPIRTYVVGTDMSNQQQMDRTIKSRSLI